MERVAGPTDAGLPATRPVAVRAGALEARLAESDREIDAVLALRYRVFYDEMRAQPSREARALRRDIDRFDAVCDHLLVVDREISGGASVVGTYRLLRRDHAAKTGGFYSAGEYDISRITSFPGGILELGRSCVDAAYRTRATMQLMWQAIATYVFHYDIALMFGCASLSGVEPSALAVPLSYLYHYHLAPPALRPRALDHLYVDMRLLSADETDPKSAVAELPPLIKGYLRLGGFVGDGAVIDHQFNTTDVAIVVKTDLVAQRYHKHFERSTRSDGSS